MYGKELTQAYQAFRDAGDEIKDKILIIEAVWHRSSIQIQFARRIFSTVPAEYCRVHLDAFETLKAKLATAVNKLESVAAPFSKDSRTGIVIGKLKYAIIRDSLDAAISDLERWQRVFDPTWFLLLRIGDKLIDSELTPKVVLPSNPPSQPPATPTPLLTARNLRGALSSGSPVEVHVSLPENGLDWETAVPIPYSSSTRIIQRAGSTKFFVVDTIVCDSHLNIASARTDAESLAKKLRHIDPSVFGLLACHGIIKRKDKSSGRLSFIDLIFRPPAGPAETKLYRAYTLRERLMQPRGLISLTQVLDIARKLASAVSFIHTCEFVHKNIRPEAIVFFGNPDDECGDLGSAYILGFDSFRNINFQTMRKGDVAWHRNLYRHPQRQGVRANEAYVMQHDVYSLGVCLLELGLWESFVSYRKEGMEGQTVVPNESMTQLLGDVVSGDGGEVESALPPPSGVRAKERLVHLARTRLPVKMGDRYTAVVVTCLTCLDEDNVDFFGDAGEDTMQDKDGVLVGARFIEKVLFRLDEICV
ncbi:hypothetical protein QBC47DRAFT_96883 [Echria macrotheca]|uniref:Protein kinase domain-containing protein n=1 Tax=Echria macrotheca TaxID=438768 RepID=A0AAJ0FD19_9PEZI|nr:hypothetical protein QBC47DRAFT_96883 [Echria macrotheca]